MILENLQVKKKKDKQKQKNIINTKQNPALLCIILQTLLKIY